MKFGEILPGDMWVRKNCDACWIAIGVEFDEETYLFKVTWMTMWANKAFRDGIFAETATASYPISINCKIYRNGTKMTP